MKKLTIVLITILSLYSCDKKSQAVKPQHLIDEQTMMEILYDLNILQSIKNNDFKLITEHNLDPEQFIYKKYQIDSLQLAESHKYYVADIDHYEHMINQIIARIEKEQETLPKEAKNRIHEIARDIKPEFQ